MLKKILPTTNFEKTNLVVFSDSKTRELKFENLNLYTKELSELRKTYRDKIIEENTKIVTNMVSHYYYHDEKYLFDNIGKSPRIIDAAIKISGYLYNDKKGKKYFSTSDTMKFKKAMDDMIDSYTQFISMVVKIHNELNAVFDLINNDEDTYKKTQMVNYTVELNKLVESGKFSDPDKISILKQFNDIRNIVLHEDARMFMMMFKIDQIRAMITCIRICKVLMRQLILENFPKIELGIDKGVLQYNGGLMLKSGFIE